MAMVLMLNASYEPIKLVHLQRAVALLVMAKAEVVEVADMVLRSQHMTMAMPLVIRLVRYVAIPRKRHIPCTRRFVLLRDRETCQYCGDQPGRKLLTIDHVLPKTQGGTTEWGNVVAACGDCNGRKGGRTPSQANMALLSIPKQPVFAALGLYQELRDHAVWSRYSF